ncbi:FG-GAP repeat domain-containing protein [Leeuwenhoekiella parthenopeia]|uniref:VCBS repeat-containing protein n=1 Tax=Leeuwenhoekiella parthenopeia TaxID=2890320 RepID=A0ABS8GS86_9FLAO|nr:VCBS repeat-containing protein [Leeuwenhoekiella parthenopeia]MCC4212847.1 VCBS repeat-containing protein [Leeuwenhoekiella parthenopeia]
MPYRVSMDDPALAVGNFDGNGLKDVYIGNSSGNAAKFFLNNRYEFKEKSIECFEQDAVFEDNAALFFDADNDGDLDLYVGSGVPLIQEEKFFVDRLYINYEGDFKKSDNKIPLNFYNTSVVLSFDYDFDGDLDLFVGNRSKPYHFGEPVKSHILRNDGYGNFTISEDFIIEGNVSDAIIKDVNGDEILDLLIALEWDAPKIYLGTGKKFKSVNFNSELKGLWQAIEAFDVDRDGDLDIVLGNWGLNTKFSLNETPITMYYSDFDRNGESEIITTYSINGEEYPLNSLGELKSQMTQIGRYFTTNASFAGKSIDEIFDSSVFEKSISYSINQLASGYIRNDDGMFLYFEPFDKSLQTAPIRVFLPITIKNDKGLLVFGNALDVNTYHGGYSSLKGSWLKSANEFIMLSDLGIDPLSEQVKAAALVNFNNQDMLIIVSNNSEIKTFIFN